MQLIRLPVLEPAAEEQEFLKKHEKNLLFGLGENLFLGFWMFFPKEKCTKFGGEKPFKLQK